MRLKVHVARTSCLTSLHSIFIFVEISSQFSLTLSKLFFQTFAAI